MEIEKEQRILIPLVYYDIFSYPLTFLEIKKRSWVGERISDDELFTILKKMEDQKVIESHEGFFCLKNRSAIITERKDKYIIAERKFRKARRIAKIFRYFPGVRAIAVCNSLASSNSREDSDIDLLIITSPDKIWAARFFSAGLLKILNLRPTEKISRDKICLSFFVSEEAPDLRGLSLPDLRNNFFGDIYFNYWLSELLPIYDEGVFQKFFEANSWVRDYLPENFSYETCVRRQARRIPFWFKKIINFFLAGEFLEAKYRDYQLKILPDKLKNLAREGDTRVVVNEDILKFHDEDRRREFYNKFIENFEKIYNDGKTSKNN